MELDSRTELFLYATELSLNAEIFYGSDISPQIGRELPTLPSIMEVMAFLVKQTPGKYHDVVEICGGEARTSKILISRRRYDVGPNFDLVAGIDLLQKGQEEEL